MPFEQIPYTNFHGTNQDWMIQQIKQMIATWASYQENFDQWRNNLDAAFNALHDYVYTYFDELDVQQEINNKLDQMREDGVFDEILLPYFNTYTQDINNTILNQNNKITTLENRVNNFLENTGTLGTEKDPELIDIRVGANGTTYASAGDAVRGQVSDLNNALKVNLRDLNSYNLLDNFNKTNRNANGISWAWNGESVYAHGTATATENLNIFSSQTTMPEGFNAGETYYVKYTSTNITLRIYDYTSGAVQIASFKQDGSFTIPETCQGLIIRLSIANETTVDETVTPIIYSTPSNEDLYDSIETLTHNVGTIKNVIDEKKEYFEHGGIDSGTGKNSDHAQTARIRTVLIHKAIDVFSLYVSVSSNYPNAAMYLHFYDENGEYTGNSGGWITEYTFKKGEIFRIVLTLDSTAATSIFTADEIFNAVFIDNTKNKIVKMVSHQGNVNSDNNQCKAEGYRLAGKSGFDYGECDIKFTSDNVPVCCHDATFVDSTSGETVTISTSTYADLIQHNYYGGTISSLEDVVLACKESGIGLYIDQYGNNISIERVQIIFDVLNKHRFARNVKHIVYTETPATRILEVDPHAWIVAGQPQNSPDASAAIAIANAIKTNNNKVDVMLWQGLGANVIETALQTMDPEYGLNVYRCDSRDQKLAMMPFVTSITTNMSSSLYIE